MMRISPSIASADQMRLAEAIEKTAENTNVHTLHIDIEDGNYVPNITFGLRTVNQARSLSKLPFSYHLMVSNPAEFIAQLPLQQGDIVFVHDDATRYPSELIAMIKSRGGQAGLAFNPMRPLLPSAYLFSSCDALLILTSEPDGKGQMYLPQMERKMIEAKDLGIKDLWVDGGIFPAQFPKLAECGGTDAVLGRAFFQA
ncbi:MAG: ribulose-phosphate 3-epimerase [Brevinema sp.]